ncbi:MFS transporter [Amycolatopsis suaedae]|uniref:MFS transporter n=1 Tax=Amycolatopsis suaedae TaxID=2510978 RepID=A0A4V2ELJ6_9PSEU|nr:MFS transporter [Amycolatopsis suaedae]RZQ61795.1 MFS transporter [Amycolatopsis suaedae]
MLRYWPAVVAVALGTFATITTQLLPVGLLTAISPELGITEGAAGLTVTIPGLVAAVAAPVIAVAAGRLDRRIVLGGLLVLLIGANTLAAVAPNYPVLLAGRVLVGVSVGGFWAVAAGVAGRLVPEHLVGRAISVVYSGVSLASVLGLPAGRLIADLTTWRITFTVLGVLAFAVLAVQALLLPPLPPHSAVRPADLPRLLRDPTVRFAFGAVFLIVAGHFGAYTYLVAFLERAPAVPRELVSTLLLVYGAAGLIGTFTMGTFAQRAPRHTLAAAALSLALAAVTLPFAGGSLAAVIGLLVVWGAAYGGVPLSLQVWLYTVVPKSTEAASALFVTAFQVAISLGSLFGGLLLDTGGPDTVLWAGGALAGVTALTLGLVSPRRAR